VKYGGNFYVLENDVGLHAATAHRLLKNRRVPGRVLDLDKLTGKIPHLPPLAKPPKAPKAVAVPTAEVPTGPRHETILKEKIGDARGSNKGGFYRGADGIDRYVKFYDDDTQAQSEHLANQVYRELGLFAPESEVFEFEGKKAYASKLFTGGRTLGEAGLTKDRAREALNGFVADMFVGNWDAAGTGHDNMMVLQHGDIARIDNGGTFLFRAKAGRKPTSALNALTEWDGFVNQNPSYKMLFERAGYSGPDDPEFKKLVVGQINVLEEKKIFSTLASVRKFVDDHAPGMKIEDRRSIVSMLDFRFEALRDKRAELLKPSPPKPEKHPEALKMARFVEKPRGGVRPRAGLRVEDLPETEVEWRLRDEILPSGESRSAYKARLEKKWKGDVRGRSSVRDFTGTSSTRIRENEVNGNHDTDSIQITKALEESEAEPGTVYRGVHAIETSTVEGILTGAGLDDDGTFRLGLGNKGATTSFSWSSDVARMFGNDLSRDSRSEYSTTWKILYQADGFSQVGIEHISQSPGEGELGFGVDAEFDIRGISRLKGTERTIVVELVEKISKKKKGKP
jgi:hypothetical protein